ncbi:MAG: FliG C-terminal domain-containing protein [Pseudomonadota bacterium]
MTVTPNLPALAPQTALAPPPQADGRGQLLGMRQSDKAAIVLAAIGPGAAAPILKTAGDIRTKRFARILGDLPQAPATTVDAVLTEFLERLEDESGVAGGSDLARSFLAEVMSPSELDIAMADINGEAPSVWRSLAQLPDQEVLEWIEGEHPHVASVALTQMPSDKSARLIEAMPQDAARDLMLRMGQNAFAPPQLVGRIAQALEDDFLPKARMRAEGSDPADQVANVLNHVEPELREEILETLTEAKPALGASVRRIMFTFENIPERLQPRDVAIVTRAVSEASLLRALKLEDPSGKAVAEFILGNISSRLADRLRGDLADLDPPSQSDSDAARTALVTAITEARDAGEIKLMDPA